ncbi:MAG: septum formation protein Maf [Proteobacteria bacterium]|nr:septum formation protein Maf [Pseudomonadota bacterium]
MTPLTGIDLILASSSKYRRELLSRLTPNFRSAAPDIDETPLGDECANDLAGRLAWEKARAVARTNPGAMVIGSDQVAHVEGIAEAIGKPGTSAAARAQLAAFSGRCVWFRTAVCVLDARTESDPRQMPRFIALDTTRVYFRDLDADTIARYVERERPLDCAGSFKAEGLGIALFERIESNDPTALIGLPLIVLCRLLREAGIDPL